MEPDLPLRETARSSDGENGDDADTATYGRFVARGVIGRGGMGVVLRARDPELDREVALKLLRPEKWHRTETSIGSQRLEREAQAMAKLAHPNVLTVYEMGRIGDARFIAMELVEGTTLREWLAAKPRPWREIVAAFLQCARGLAAAHDAGLVHRDFKPDNVLVGADDRPRVADFGLVASGVAVASDDAGSAPPGAELSVNGAVVGTPAYMAPEQWSGDDIDARADQFAFCVALWEALSGEHPFPGRGAASVRRAVLEGVLGTPNARMPRALIPILRRGLALERDVRWPTMRAMIDALEPTLVRRNTLAWSIAGGAVLAASIAIFAGTRSEGCEVPTERLAGIWDDRLRVGVEPRLAQALDDYAQQWLVASVTACRASDSPGLRDKRAVCLERARTSLGALTQTLVGATPAVVERAYGAVGRLPDLTACADLERLAATMPPPSDPALRARLAVLDQELDAIEVLRLRGEQAAALAKVKGAVAEARAIGYAPELARALNALGGVHGDASDHVAAEAAFREAASAAADGHDDVLAAEAWANVLFAASERNENLAAAAALDPVVDAAVRRAGDPPRLRFFYLISSGTLADRRDDFATAITRYTAASKIAPTPRQRAEAERDIAVVIWRRDGAAKAVAPILSALALTEAAAGAAHLDTAHALSTAAQILNAAGRFGEAKTYAERALAIQTRIHGPESLAAAGLYVILGNIGSNLHDAGSARAHLEHALAIHQRAKVPDASLAMSIGAIGALLQYETRQLTEAIPYYVRALELLERSVGPDAMEYMMMSSNLATTYQEAGRCADARPIIAKVGPGLSKMPAYYPELLTISARCNRATDPSRAIAEYEESLKLCLEHQCGFPATLKWELGAALVEMKRDRVRGLALVREARALAAADPKDPLTATIDAWLLAHAR